MKQLRKKLNSQRGASILLALLFMLLCVLASSSILMAAASNAGKIRNTRREQQQYLALSSALRLVSGALDGASYEGSYTYTRQHFPATGTPGDEDYKPAYDKHTYEQKRGKFTFAGVFPENTPLLPLKNDLDILFKKAFQNTDKIPEKKLEDIYTCKPSSEVPLTGAPYTLTLEVQGSAEEYPGLAGQKVQVRVELGGMGAILLTATLTDADGISSSMRAELKPQTPLETALSLRPPAEGDAGTPTETVQTEKVEWKLARITRD